MTYQPARFNLTSVAAACILSGGLIAAAIIDAHKPTVAAPNCPVTAACAVAARTAVGPPISQEAASEQLRSQLLSLKFNAVRDDYDVTIR